MGYAMEKIIFTSTWLVSQLHGSETLRTKPSLPMRRLVDLPFVD